MTTREKLLKIIYIGGFTQNSLSIELGVSFPTINSWINERSIPRDEAQNEIDTLLSKLEAKNKVNANELKLKIDNIENYANHPQTSLNPTYLSERTYTRSS